MSEKKVLPKHFSSADEDSCTDLQLTIRRIAKSINVLHYDALKPVPAIFGQISRWNVFSPNWCLSSQVRDQRQCNWWDVFFTLTEKSLNIPALWLMSCFLTLIEKSINILHYDALSAPFKPVPAIFGPCSLPYIWTHHPAPGFKTKCFEGVNIPKNKY